jgi:hypothetical protein
MPLYEAFLPRQPSSMDTLDPRFDPKFVRKRGIRQNLSDSLKLVVDIVGESSHQMSGQWHIIWRDYLCGQSDCKRCHLGDIRFHGDRDIKTIGQLDVRSRPYILTIVVL